MKVRNNNWVSRTPKQILGIMILAVILCMSACGGQKNDTSNEEVSIDLKALQEDMLTVDTTLPEMVAVSSDEEDAKLNFTYLSDLDYDLVDSYFYSYAKDGTAPELAVVKLKDSSDVAAMMDSLRAHLEQRKGTFQEYSPEQVELVENCVLTMEGRYVCMIVSEKSGLVQAEFKNCFAQKAQES